MRNVPPFYLDVIWHPERGRLSNRMARDYLERQVVPAVAKKQRLTRKLFDAGARLFLGTDVAQPFVVPGASLQQEMALFVEAGIGIEQVWKLATRDAGDRLGIEGLGRIEAGAPAEFCCFAATRLKASTTLRAWRRLSRQAGFTGQLTLHKRCMRARPISTHP